MDFPHLEKEPVFGKGVYVAPTASVIGEVAVGDDSSIWFNAVVRGDVNWIRIGSGTNIQDGSSLHVTYEKHPLVIGNEVAVGHGCVLHGCSIGDGCLIGIGAIVLDGVHIGRGSIIGAGAVVAEGSRIPAGHLVLGVPGKVIRPVKPEETDRIDEIIKRYVQIKNLYIKRTQTS